MFDTMTSTKVIAAFCGTLLIFLLVKWAADSQYYFGAKGYGEDAQHAFIIETDEGEGEETAAVEEDFATFLAAADVDKGAKVYNKCRACHKKEAGANATGPSLFAIVGSDIGAVSGYGYSSAMSELGGSWTPEELNSFLENPKKYAAGTTMSFSGLKKISDRANLIAYLMTIGS